ncbi:NAD(P)-dependent oxidoreductase [Bacteroidales bacterium OttesenSCG-928-C03]|nr:NAD(P)-dependent oxidoreductase [Bacteroidales bacterium OttesenSCG-928-C03]
MEKNILLTGATGIMGFETLKQLIKNESFYITLLARSKKKNRKKLKKFLHHDRVRIVWGDLCNYDDVSNAMQGADIVLHLGGMVTPEADRYPELTMKINVTAAENIVKAAKAQPNADRIKVVYIGSVAQLGPKNAPEHFGCSGDIMNPLPVDKYAVSKIIAEKTFAESGLNYWVSLRQSAILYSDLIKKGFNPIIFHVPLLGVLEWSTIEDSGRLLVKLCETELPDTFWKNFYNISSGNSYRMTNYEFETRLLEAIYCPPPEKIFEPNWFAIKNFHGCWYSDADLLEDYLHFRDNIPVEDYFLHILRKQTPWYFRLAKIVPSGIIKWILKRIAYHKTEGTLHWIQSGNEEKIATYFGSVEEWKKIPSWENFENNHPSEECKKRKRQDDLPSTSQWKLTDMQLFASSLNGKCLSETMTEGDLDTPLLWQNANGDTFRASPRYVVLGGYFPEKKIDEYKNI